MARAKRKDITFKQRYSPKIATIPYLIIPIKRMFQVSEGFIYTRNERQIHGNFFHNGIDFECEINTPVYAAASGYAVASYHRFVVLNKDRTIRLYKNKPLGNGFGYFVQIFHPERICGIPHGRITQYGHLSRVSEKIRVKITEPIIVDIGSRITKYYKTRRKNRITKAKLEKLIAENQKIIKKYPWTTKFYGFSFDMDLEKRESYLYTLDELKKLSRKGSKYVTWVEQGDHIGSTGQSAIIHGKLPYLEGDQDINIQSFETWDEPHLHFEEAMRDQKTLRKHIQRDPYGIYKSKKWYKKPDPDSTLFKQ